MIRKELIEALARVQHDFGLQLANERQRQLMGEGSDSSLIIADAARIACELYATLIAPRWDEARNNCALGRVLLMFSLSFERQLQVMGVADTEETCTRIANLPICMLSERCLWEIEECCRLLGPSPYRAMEVLSLARQQALSGDDCISDDRFMEALGTCTNLAWDGALRIVQRGDLRRTLQLTDPFGSPVGLETIEQSMLRLVEGVVVQANEDWFDPSYFLTVHLTVRVAEVLKSVVTKTTETSGTQCSSITVSTTEVNQKGEGDVFVQLSFHEDGSYEIVLTPIISTTGTIDYSFVGRGCANTDSRSVISGLPGGLGAGVHSDESPGEDIKKVRGQLTQEGPYEWLGGGIFPATTQIHFDWQFQRKQDLPWGPQ